MGEMCGAECLSHCLFRIGETFRRRGFGANFGFSLERGNVMTILDSAPALQLHSFEQERSGRRRSGPAF